MDRKIISILLAATFALCAFAGCAKEEDSEPVPEPASQTQNKTEQSESETEAVNVTTEAVSTSSKTTAGTKPATTAAVEKDSAADIYSALKKCLEKSKNNGVLPEYSVFDINGDGTAELLIFDERIATAIERGITVYSFDKKSGSAKEIGRAETFEGHSKICASADGNGFVIQQDYPGFIKVTRYTFDGQTLHEEKLIDKPYNGDIVNAISDEEKGNEYLGDEIICSLDMGEGNEKRLFEKAFG